MINCLGKEKDTEMVRSKVKAQIETLCNFIFLILFIFLIFLLGLLLSK